MLELKPITDDASHQPALKRAWELMNKEPLTKAENKEFDKLADLIYAYEEEHYPMP